MASCVSPARNRYLPSLAVLTNTVVGISLLGWVASAEATTLYVSTNGADSPSCGTQSAPCRNPDYAVTKAVSGDTIEIAGGTYFFANVANACDGVSIPSAVVCVVDKSITILGGYSPATWVFDPAANHTVIDGGNTRRGVFVGSSGGLGMRLTMANITIQNGRALALALVSDQSAFGGGMDVYFAAVTLDGVTFQSNQAIGGNTIAPSEAGGAAAGSALSIISSPGGAVSFLNHVLFQSNSSVGGQGPARGGHAFGALFVGNSIVNVDKSSFISNTAQGGSSPGSGRDSLGTSAAALGGAVGVESGGSVSLARVTASGNQVSGGTGTTYGGGGFGGAVFVEDSAVAIADSLFRSNVALGAAATSGAIAAGGGILILNSNGTIDRTRILANSATGGASSASQPAGAADGGGVCLWLNTAAGALTTQQIKNTVIADNVARLGSTGTNPGGGGGGVFAQGRSVSLTHVTFARNQLGPGLVAGQAMAVIEAPAVPATTSVGLDYSVVADHTAGATGATALWVNPTNTLNLNVGAFSGNTTNAGGGGTINGLGTMLNVGSPVFVSPGAPNYDYHIGSTSPLRDAATGSSMPVDMDNQPRTDGLPDVGADEYDPDLIFKNGFQW